MNLLGATLTIALAVPYVASGGPEQVMDVFWTPRPPSATVLFVHGGSLQESGERRTSPMYRDVCRPFVAAGIACASMDYRLAPTHPWPAMPEDVAAAVVTLRRLVGARGGDPRRVFLFGHSSGCHLAAVVGTDPKYLQAVGLTPRDLGGVIAMGCTLDREDVALKRPGIDRVRQALAADAVDTRTYGTAETWLDANPASHVGPRAAPTLVVLAEAERFQPPILEQGARFVRRLLEAGVAADLVVVPGNHTSSIAGLGGKQDRAFPAIRRFLDH